MLTGVSDTHGSGRPSRGRQHTDGSLVGVIEDPHCRHLLDYLTTTDGAAHVSAAARHVVARMTARPPDDVPDSARRQAETLLTNGFLPELDGEGVVEYDPDAGTVHLRESPAA